MRDDRVLKLGEHELETPIICASIIGKDLNLMDDRIEKALEQGVGMIELRLDKLRDSSGWRELLCKGVPTIVTNRAGREGGNFEGKESERVERLFEAIDEGVACIDIELSTPREQLDEVLSAARANSTSVILSFHNFEEVPPIEDLIETARQMEELDCGVAKLIGFTKNFRDGMRMLDFLLEVSEEVKVPVISFAMGRAGKFTRVMAPLFGSPIVYASVEEAAAPGQVDVVTMKGFLETIGSES